MDAMGPIYHQSRPASVFSYIFAATFSLFQLQLLMLETQSCGLDIATNWYIYIYISGVEKPGRAVFTNPPGDAGWKFPPGWHETSHLFWVRGSQAKPSCPTIYSNPWWGKGCIPNKFQLWCDGVCVCVFFLWTCQNEDSLDLFLSKLLDIFSQFEAKPTSYVWTWSLCLHKGLHFYGGINHP